MDKNVIYVQKKTYFFSLYARFGECTNLQYIAKCSLVNV